MRKSLLALAVVSLCAMSASGSVVTTFTGGDAGEGLDMQGTFVYAINLAGIGGQVVGDATFTHGAPDQGYATAGFSKSSNISLGKAPLYDFGSSANDTALETLLWSNLSTYTYDTFSFDLAAGTYKIQVLSAEPYGAASRFVDLDFGNDGMIDCTMDSAANGNIGMVATHTVTMATAGTYTIRYGNTIYPDIPLIQAATVEAITIPEPATMALLALGVGALIRRRK